jgi:hypothetical protein
LLLKVGVQVILIGDAAGGHGIQKAIREATQVGEAL